MQKVPIGIRVLLNEVIIVGLAFGQHVRYFNIFPLLTGSIQLIPCALGSLLIAAKKLFILT
jgi:hypothetical protein